MTLADTLANTKPSRTGKPCAIELIMAGLSDRDAEALKAAMAVPKGDPARLSSEKIAEALRSEGYTVRMKTIENHRKGACRCESGR